MEQTPSVSAGPRTPLTHAGAAPQTHNPFDWKKRQWATPRGHRTPEERGGESQGASWRKSGTSLKSMGGKAGVHRHKKKLKQLSVEGGNEAERPEGTQQGLGVPEEGGATRRDIPDRPRKVGTGQRPLERQEEAWKRGD